MKREKPSRDKSNRDKSNREKLIFDLGKLLAVMFLGPGVWVLLLFGAWYCENIPEAKKNLPYAYFWRTHQPKFYKWLAGFLGNWAVESILMTVLIGGALSALGAGAKFLLVETLSFISYPIIVGLCMYLGFVLSTAYMGFSMAKTSAWDIYVWKADSAARALVGSEYDQLPEQEKQALSRHCAEVEIGINKGTWLVMGGKAEVRNAPSETFAKFGGPGVLIVQEGHVAILERSGRTSRMVGAGLTRLEPFERVHQVVYLPTRVEVVDVNDAMTRDKMVLKSFTFLVFQRVDRGNKSQASGRYRYDPDVIMDGVWSAKGGDSESYRGTIKQIAGQAARDVIARYNFEDIVAISGEARVALIKELVERTNATTQTYLGIQVSGGNIGEIKISEEAQKILEQKALAEVQRQTMIMQAEAQKDAMARKGEGQALAIRRVEMEKSTIRRELLQQLMEPLRAAGGDQPLANKEIADRYMAAVERLLERLEATMVRDDLDMIRYIEALQAISSAEGNKTFIIGDTKGVPTTFDVGSKPPA